MANASATVRYFRHDDTATFRVTGRATMAFGLPVRQTAERLLAEGVRFVRMDLRDCQYMDSTFLGTLLTIKKGLERLERGPLTIIAPSTSCMKILDGMGLGDFIPTNHDPPDTDAAWIEVRPDNTDPGSFRQNIEQAHRELAALPGPAGEQFQAAIRCIDQAAPTPPPPTRPSE